MNLYRVHTEVRPDGAQGIYQWRQYECAAETMDEARDISHRFWHEQQNYRWDTRGVRVEEISTAEQMAMFDNQKIEEEYR